MSQLVAYLVERMREASSYAGVALVILGALRINADPTLVNAVLSAIAAIGGVMAVLIPSTPKQTPPPSLIVR